jgi:hypothetical protein
MVAGKKRGLTNHDKNSGPYDATITQKGHLRGKRFTVCTEITIILGTVWFTIRGGRLRYKQYDVHFLKKSSIELPFSSFGDHLINILRKVNRLIYGFKIN